MKKVISIFMCVAVLVGGFLTYKTMASEPKDTVAESCTLYDGDTKANDAKGKIKADEFKIEIVTGDYVGQIDNNSVEIKISGEAIALYFSPEVSDTFSSKNLKLNDKVTISYYKNKESQNILTAIEKQ